MTIPTDRHNYFEITIPRSVADRFGLSTTGCWTSVHDICNLLLKINFAEKIISFPQGEEAERVQSQYFLKTRFPGVIGCIDGTHIAIAAPKMYPNSFINRKKYHSVLLQTICNEKMIFTDCYCGEVGSIHDSCLFRRSNLFQRITNESIVIRPENHLLGDQGYGLKPYLLIPFKDNGSLTDIQKKYNQTLSKIRVVIERAFGLLKGRFRRLYYLQTRKPQSIPLIIMAACILHNLCIRNNDNMDTVASQTIHL